jgi:hypothetical protein
LAEGLVLYFPQLVARLVDWVSSLASATDL